MSKWIAEFDLEDGDTMPEHMDLEYKGAKLDFYCRPMWIPCNPLELPKDKKLWVTHDRWGCRYVDDVYWDMTEWSDNVSDVVAYMPYIEPEPYKAESEEV